MDPNSILTAPPSRLSSIFDKSKKFLKQICYFLFPMVRMNQLEHFIEINNLFGGYPSYSSKAREVLLLVICLLTCLSGFRVPILTKWQPKLRNTVGQVGDWIFSIAAFECIECAALRIWVYWTSRKYQSKDEIEIIQLIKQLGSKTKDVIVLCCKLITIPINISSYAFVLTLVLIEPTDINLSGVLLNLFYFFGYFEIIRRAINDVIILYVYSVAGFFVVMDKMEALRKSIAEYDHFQNPMFDILANYAQLIKSVKQLNSVATILMVSSNSLVIPLGSLDILMAITPTDSLTSELIRLSMFAGAAVYTLRGYILIVILSRVDTVGKKLSRELYSTILRCNQKDVLNVKRIAMILEDMSSSSSRIVAREKHSIVNQMDALNSLSSTVSTLALIFDLRGST